MITDYTWTIILVTTLSLGLSFTKVKSRILRGFEDRVWDAVFCAGLDWRPGEFDGYQGRSGFDSGRIRVGADSRVIYSGGLPAVAGAVILVRDGQPGQCGRGRVNTGGGCDLSARVAPVGLLLAILGNIMGTYLGILCGHLCRWVSGP